MSPTNPMNTHPANMAPAAYSPVEDRQDYGVQKNRKQASTGGGRAWSEDEEVYLLQTRLQKMPYKHIAAHLKKTELACRLHYHQLSHGSNRRKRTTSVASETPSAQHSPIMQNTPSPIHEHAVLAPATPPYNYSPRATHNIQLPSAASLLPAASPRPNNHPVAILPKPSPIRRALSESTINQPPLRLETAAHPIDQTRLRAIYDSHRASFWSVIAAEYGSGASPYVLEDSWKNCFKINGPPTPSVSPTVGYAYQKPAPVQETKKDATSISALLGIDASPRSPKERELIRQMEKQRESLPRDILMAGIESS
ncbi:hypothetical protein BP5796_08138 [Coleophoma crateriformis]|uniref:Myb-like domain-containing protein n=1 Tax=Coleophoma crateriformis TaxID=565419 RepID=A0A3D8RE13_9HELO|nr:hypothetical protein BP5796_08138 [Coleophoma crateriformis]